MDNVMVLTTHELSKLPFSTYSWIVGLTIVCAVGFFLCILWSELFTDQLRSTTIIVSIFCGLLALVLLIWAPRESAGIEHQVVVTGPVNIEEFLDTYEITDRENNLFTVIEK